MFSMYPEVATFGKITDGASNTLLLGESRQSLPGDGYGPKAAGAWNNIGWASPWAVTSTVFGVQPQGWDYYMDHAFSSRHPGGANFTMTDGSVRFISQNIDIRLFNNLGSKAGGEPTSDF